MNVGRVSERETESEGVLLNLQGLQDRTILDQHQSESAPPGGQP